MGEPGRYGRLNDILIEKNESEAQEKNSGICKRRCGCSADFYKRTGVRLNNRRLFFHGTREVSSDMR